MECSMRCVSGGDAAARRLTDRGACFVAHGQSNAGDGHTMADTYPDGDAHPIADIDANCNPYSVSDTAAGSDAGAASEPRLS